MRRFGVGDRVRIDIPDTVDSDFEQSQKQPTILNELGPWLTGSTVRIVLY